MNKKTQKPPHATPLTDSQKEIIATNINLFDVEISKLPGMDGTTPRQIADYRKRISRPSDSEHRKLAEHLEAYIQHNGLPSRFGDVIQYLKYLRERG